VKKFHDRIDAGKMLANDLKEFANLPDTIVLALPRGGVPVAYEIAKTISAPLDVFIVRKLGVPDHEELAMGAIASGGTIVFNNDILNQFHIPETAINRVIQAEEKELNRRELSYRRNRPFPALAGKTIILVDDGIATGATMRAAIQALRKHEPATIIVAVPVAANSTCKEIQKLVDQLICLISPTEFNAVGQWYDDFPQTTDEEVDALLNRN
jgi:predicted phosphoribosyltransferase